MGKRYYCDYCDKTMVSSISIIRTHMKGVPHQKLVNDHYQQYKDPETVLKEESIKNPCSKFARGECKFGSICRYSHYTPYELNEIRLKVATKTNKEKDPQTFFEINNKEQIKSINTDKKYTTMYDENGVTHVFPWTYNDLFDNYDNLPPSIKKLKSTDFIDLNISKWG